EAGAREAAKGVLREPREAGAAEEDRQGQGEAQEEARRQGPQEEPAIGVVEIAVMRIVPAALFAALSFGSLSSATATELSEVSAQDYYEAAYFKGALDNPKISKLRHDQQISVIARDLRIKPKNLQQAIKKVEALCGEPEAIGKVAEKALMSSSDRTRIKGRL